MWMATKEMMLMSIERKYLCKICVIGFLDQTMTEAATYLYVDLEPLLQERIKKI